MLAVGVSPQIKKKRKRTTDSLTPLTKPTVKKTKVLATPSDATPSSKKKKKKILDAEVPELVLCADKLKPEIKLEVKNDTETKIEVPDDPPCITTPVQIKSEPVSPVKKKKKAKIKEEIIEPEIPVVLPVEPQKKKKKKSEVPVVKAEPVEEVMPIAEEPSSIPKPQKKKKKKSKVVEPLVEPLVEPKVEISPPKKVKKKKKKSEIVIPEPDVPMIKAEPLDDPIVEEPPIELQNELQSGDLDKLEEKDVKDEKPSLSLFNSDIKQELLVEDHIDQQLVRSLTYNEDDPCIHHQTTEIHIALPPVYTGRIQEGIDMTMKQHSLKYMRELKGVLLKYSILSLQNPTGRYLSTRPEFHFNITCQTTAFKPKIDQSLTGTVVKMGPGYVNCLVYGYFTAVVYGRFQSVLEPGTLISFKLKHYQQTSSDDLVLKGVPEVAPSS